MTTTAFAGMPDEGLAFLEDLEERNTKDFFDANKAVFKEQVQAPFAALVEAAAARLRRSVPDLGRPKVFRIYRDLRFSKDKTPYKTSMSASVPSRPREDGDGPGIDTGFYVNVGPAGLYVACTTRAGRSWSGPGPPWATRTAGRSWRRSCAGPPARAWSRGSTRSSACPSRTRPTTRGPPCSRPAPWS